MAELSFGKELAELLNRHSRENDSNTPDFIIAQYLLGALGAFERAIQQGELHGEWTWKEGELMAELRSENMRAVEQSRSHDERTRQFLIKLVTQEVSLGVVSWSKELEEYCFFTNEPMTLSLERLNSVSNFLREVNVEYRRQQLDNLVALQTRGATNSSTEKKDG